MKRPIPVVIVNPRSEDCDNGESNRKVEGDFPVIRIFKREVKGDFGDLSRLVFVSSCPTRYHHGQGAF